MAASRSTAAGHAVTIRPYRPSDEDAVRGICFDTALYGRSIEGCLADRSLVTEALLGYYLRLEPDAFFVAEVGGTVAAYLTGSRDTVRFASAFTGRVAPWLALRFVRGGHWRRAASWRIAFAVLVNGFRWSRVRRRIVGIYPAHCHVNVNERFRGQGLGGALLRSFLDLLESQSVPGVHVSTESDEGTAFFAAQGFVELAHYRMLPMCGEEPTTAHVMGLTIRAARS